MHTCMCVCTVYVQYRAAMWIYYMHIIYRLTQNLLLADMRRLYRRASESAKKINHVGVGIGICILVIYITAIIIITSTVSGAAEG